MGSISGEASFGALPAGVLLGQEQEAMLGDCRPGHITHLHPEGQGALALVGNSVPLFRIFSSSPALSSWVFWPLKFTWGISKLLSLELLYLATSL